MKRKLLFLMMACVLSAIGTGAVADTYKTVKLKLNSDWSAVTARYALYMYNGDGGEWTDFSGPTNNIYSASFNEKYSTMVIVRLDPSKSGYGWDSTPGFWNQSIDLPAPFADNLTYTITTKVGGDGSNKDHYMCELNPLYLRNKAVSGYKQLGADNAYGTQGSFVDDYQYVTFLPNTDKTTYKMKTMVRGDSDSHIYLGTNGFMDNNSPAYFTITVSGDYYKISFESDGTKYIGYDGSTTVLNMNASDNDNALWTFLTQAQIDSEKASRVSSLSASASPASPADLTFLITDANFGRGRIDFSSAWTNTGATLSKGGHTSAHNGTIECWKNNADTNFNLFQDLSSLPNGLYKVTCYGFYRSGSNNSTSSDSLNVHLYANNQTVYLKNINSEAKESSTGGFNYFNTSKYVPNSQSSAYETFASGAYHNEVYVRVTDGTLRIGVKKTVTPTIVDTKFDWTCFDNFQLFYYGAVNLTTATASLDNPVDMTFMINNPNVEIDGDVANNGTVTGWLYSTSANNHGTYNNPPVPFSCHAFENWRPDPGLHGGKMYQTVTGLPNGVYKFDLDALARYNGGHSVYAESNSKTFKTDLSGTRETAASYSVNNIYVNGSLEIGLKFGAEKTGTDEITDWAAIDNAALTYYGPAIIDEAVALPGDGTMIAGKWYYVDVVAGIIGFGAETIDDIVYTTNGEVLGATIDTTLPINLLNASATRYYFMSTSAQALTISKICDNFSYWFLRTSDYKYLSRGGNSRTQAVADSYGIPVRIAYENNNINFIFVDNWLHLYDADNGNLYTDADTNIDFAIEPTDGGYYVVNKNTTTNSTLNYKLYIDSSDGNRVKASNSNATVWMLEDATTTAHKTQMQAVKDAQAVATATVAGISSGFGITTQATMNTYLSTAASESITIPAVGISEEYQVDAAYNADKSIYTNTVEGLTPGLYKLTVKAFERIAGNNDTWNGGGSAGLTYVYAGDQKVQLWSVFDFPAESAYTTDYPQGGNHYPDDKSSAGTALDDVDKYLNEVFVWVTGTSLTYGITMPNNYRDYNADPNNTWYGNKTTRGNWIAYQNFTLTYYPNVPFVISENTTYANDVTGTANVTLERTFVNDGTTWNTFCVPFDISNAELTATFSDVAVAEYSSAANADGVRTDVSFNKMVTPAITANTPVLLKTSSTATTFNFIGRTLSNSTPEVVGGHGFDFVGSYEDEITIASGDYIIYYNQLRKSTGKSKIKGTRAYIKTKEGDAGGRIGSFFIDGEETTSIDGMELNDTEATDRIYNLQGQELKSLRKSGIYIQNGKKVVIK